MMLAPMRTVLAAEQTHCDMADMDMSEMSVSTSTAMQSHDMSKMSSIDMSTGQLVSGETAVKHQCCCCDNNCVDACDMGMSVSILMQASNYSPTFVDTRLFTSSSLSLVVRALTPPSRPPASLS